MEQYREKLKLTQRITTVAVLIIAVFGILTLCAEGGLLNISPATEDSHLQSMWRGFLCGAACGIGAMMLIELIRIHKALRDEKALKKLYIQDNDERQVKIWTSARALAMQIFLILGLVAGVIAGYFNMTVSITIFACIVGNAFIGMGCKLYFSRKY